LLDAEVRLARMIARNAVQPGWKRHEGRYGVELSANAKSESFFQATTLAHNETVSGSPKLRDAIVGLCRDDPLRRVYLRRWWKEPKVGRLTVAHDTSAVTSTVALLLNER
jgi:hypothetical protein